MRSTRPSVEFLPDSALNCSHGKPSYKPPRLGWLYSPLSVSQKHPGWGGQTLLVPGVALTYRAHRADGALRPQEGRRGCLRRGDAVKDRGLSRGPNGISRVLTRGGGRQGEREVTVEAGVRVTLVLAGRGSRAGSAGGLHMLEGAGHGPFSTTTSVLISAQRDPLRISNLQELSDNKPLSF